MHSKHLPMVKDEHHQQMEKREAQLLFKIAEDPNADLPPCSSSKNQPGLPRSPKIQAISSPKEKEQFSKISASTQNKSPKKSRIVSPHLFKLELGKDS
jgi:hypothetical protein